MVIKSIGLTIIMCFLGFSCSSLQSGMNPSEVVKRYYELALEGKVNEALSLWTDCNSNENPCVKAENVDGEDVHTRWTKQIQESKEKIENIEEKKVEKDSISILVNSVSSTGKRSKTIYKLFRVNNSWKIYSFSSPAMEESEI